jgi:hypothetical protein
VKEKQKRKLAAEEAAKPKYTYAFEVRRVSLTERQLVEYRLLDGQVAEVVEHQADVGPVVFSKLLRLLENAQ